MAEIRNVRIQVTPDGDLKLFPLDGDTIHFNGEYRVENNLPASDDTEAVVFHPQSWAASSAEIHATSPRIVVEEETD